MVELMSAHLNPILETSKIRGKGSGGGGEGELSFSDVSNKKQLVASTMAPAQDSTANVMMTVADALHRHIAGYTHLYILILKRLHIESNGGYGLDRLV